MLTIPNSVINIEYAAFNDNLLPDNKAFIYARTDANNDGIAEIDRTTIVSYGGTTKDVIIPLGVTTIKECAFYNSKLTSVEISPSVTYLESSAFNDNNITIIRILSHNFDYPDDTVFANNPGQWIIYGYTGSKAEVLARYWSSFVSFVALIDLEEDMIEPIGTQTYNRTEVEPSLTVTYNNTPLVLGTDYKVTYEDNDGAGTVEKTFTIV